DAYQHQGLGLQLAGDLLLQGNARNQGRDAVRRGSALRQQRRQPAESAQPAADGPVRRADDQRDVLRVLLGDGGEAGSDQVPPEFAVIETRSEGETASDV